MNKEVHYEGWLIKSPPTKRIWRARWRRRWFTLKQGEIPEQFCLEYYTDRNCRKLKGVIDLDQCEQVDCGLRLENRKQKFQYMFDIKTPKRTYYLAADTEADMRDWVNCICQVCHLHDTKQPNNELLTDENHTFATTTNTLSCGATNVVAETPTTTTTTTTTIIAATTTTKTPVDSNTEQEILLRQTNNNNNSSNNNNMNNNSMVVLEQPHSANSEGAYVNTEYTNRETLTSVAILSQQQQQQQQQSAGAIYLNNPIIQQQQKLNDCVAQRLAVNTNGVVRKLPENLVLNSMVLHDSDIQAHSVQPSPALSTASGPYIPISECYSGSPKFIPDSNNPTTPLNNLDPKFYDTPRSHNNIGLNLTNDQSYSPKITNCGTVQPTSAHKNRSHRSDSDSESVFTDDDEWTHPLPLPENAERQTRPSDSSVENESFVLTYSQRFSKLPDDVMSKDINTKRLLDAASTSGAASSLAATSSGMAGLKPKEAMSTKSTSLSTAEKLKGFSRVFKNKNNLILDFKADNEKNTRDVPQYSDTENTSPAIGPRDAHSFVEESYDIPRSHQLAYHNVGQLREKLTSPDSNAPIAASTPNLMGNSLEQMDSAAAGPATSSNLSTSGTLPRPHYYTNAAPRKVEGNVFRYDFMEQEDLPPVNRSLKPKLNSIEDNHNHAEDAQTPADSLANKLFGTSLNDTSANESTGSLPKPPSVDRKSKPTILKGNTADNLTPSSRRSTGAPLSMMLPHDNENSFVVESLTLPRQPRVNYAFGDISSMFHQRTVSASAATPLTPTMQKQFEGAAGAGAGAAAAAAAAEHRLQYFDLDVANAPSISRPSASVASIHTAAGTTRLAGAAGLPEKPKPDTVVYNSVDFVKTEAFKRIREERKKKSEEVAANNNNNNNTLLPHQLK